MKMRNSITIALALILLCAAGQAPAQSTVTGALQGIVTDSTAAGLPGVTVTIASDALVTRTKTTVTDTRGAYRFPSLPVGIYAISAELRGFRPVKKDGARVSLGQSLAVNLTLSLDSVAEAVTVIGEAPTVSVVDNAVSSNLTAEYLERQPLSRDVNSLVNQVPGVNSGRAYGSTEERTLAFNLDGVNVSNPASGEHWALTNPDWVKEIQVVGLGAPAEYGGFTGAAFNLVTKSGGNSVKGDFVVYYTGGDLVSTNAPASAEGTALLPSTTDSDWDFSANLGGPAIKDRLWYFASAQYTNAVSTPFYRALSPESQREDVDDTKHRYMGKLTYQATERTQLVGMAFYDDRIVDNRGAGGLLLSTAARTQESPNWEYNATAESLLSSTNFLSVKFTGFSGRDDRLPNDRADKPGRNDDSTGFGWDNAAFTLRQKVERATLDASWSLFADGLLGGGDSHTFKFGANYEWGAYDQQQPRNGGFSYYDRSSRCPGTTADARTAAYFANPACAAYSSDRGNEIFLDSVQNGINVYAQDSMRVNRFTVNLGLRYTNYSAGFRSGNESVYEVSLLAPRVGLVWDVFGDSKSAIKAHYGRYFLGMFAYLYDREVSGEAYTPSEIWDYNPKTGQYDIFVRRTLTTATLDTGAGHPYTDQFLLSFEQELGRKTSLGLDLIRRDDGDIFAMVNQNDDYVVAEIPGNPLTGGTQTVYTLQSDPRFVLENAPGAYRRYESAILRFEKRYADGWSLKASVVWSELRGNALKNNSYVPEYQDRNGQVNADGLLESSSTWEGKLSASVDLPWGIKASGYYTYLSGEFWTPYARVSAPGAKNDRTNVNIVERGTEQLDDRNLVDLRLSKDFRLGSELRLSLFADAFNVFNSDTATAVDGRWGQINYNQADPSKSVWVGRVYGAPTAMERPREIRLGARVAF
ncbi:MAG: TonB-dependent receptor [Holophagales bacterium]|nr:TonB-dependent receptor [Holophagales bacterium]